MSTGQLTPRARREADFLFDDTIIAKSLAPSGLDNVVLKNPALYFKWINCSFQNGVMYETAKSKGFVNATPIDVEVPGVIFRDGAFRYGDVILMKMDKNLALGSMKAAALRAMKQGGKSVDDASHRRNLQEVLGEVNAPASQKAKIKAFTPSSSDLSGIPGMVDAQVPSK